jgi:hypothetical protein
MPSPWSPERHEPFDTFCYDSDSDTKMSDLDLGGDDDGYLGCCPLTQEPESYEAPPPPPDDVELGWESGYESPLDQELHRGTKHFIPQEDQPPPKKRRKRILDCVLLPKLSQDRPSPSPSPTHDDDDRDCDYVLRDGPSPSASPPGPTHGDIRYCDDDDRVFERDCISGSSSSSSDDDDRDSDYAESHASRKIPTYRKAVPSCVQSARKSISIMARQEEVEESTDDEFVDPAVGKGHPEHTASKATEDRDHDNSHRNFQSTPPSPFLVTADVRKRLDPRLVFIRKDVFAWKDGRHQCDHKTGRNVPKDSPINSSCALLSFLNGMYFCPLLGGILCPAHHCIVPYSDIPNHLTLHKIALRRCPLTPQDIQNHVHAMFDVPKTQDMASIAERASALRLSSPVPGLPLPDICMQCSSCKGWLISRDAYPRKGLTNHWKRNSPCNAWHQSQSPPPDPGAFPRLYAVPLFYGHSTVKAYRAVFVDDYCPSGELPRAADTTPHSHFAYHMPEYLTNFGWSPYVEGLKADWSTLIQLVAMPSDRIANTWPEGSEGRHIEQGLQVVDAFFRVYLCDANHLVNQCNDSVRRAITAG